MLLILTLIFSVFFNIAYGGTISPSSSDEKHIEYGSKFNYVLVISGEYETGPFFASSVAISPSWILTAAHVVDRSKKCFIHYNDKKYETLNVIKHHGFSDNQFGLHDIALIQLAENLDLKFYPELYHNNDEEGKLCSISGFGLTGNFHTGVEKYDGKRRAGSNYIDKIDRNLLICSPSVEHKNTELEFLIGRGDSGGGLFIGNKLAGINSCVLADDKKTDSTYGDESGHTRISEHVEWIEKTIKEVVDAQEKK